ncbi:hypothetical protein [Actinocrispum sp. NPDC049592]|uniref:hypothetical protein n=1 Tax=Actinocrispum sp. NPDC049592 TaxID=3154835 RepID=UPI003436B54E
MLRWLAGITVLVLAAACGRPESVPAPDKYRLPIPACDMLNDVTVGELTRPFQKTKDEARTSSGDHVEATECDRDFQDEHSRLFLAVQVLRYSTGDGATGVDRARKVQPADYSDVPGFEGLSIAPHDPTTQVALARDGNVVVRISLQAVFSGSAEAYPEAYREFETIEPEKCVLVFAKDAAAALGQHR